jgi:hypothetical protein
MRTFLKAAKLPHVAFSLYLLGMGALLVGCPAHGLNVRVYYLSNEDGGLVRKQAGEVIPFQQAEGYRCMNQQDFDAVVELVRSCIDKGSAQ